MAKKCKKCGNEKCSTKDCGHQEPILIDSGKFFPDGANYRIEVSGIETAEILGAVVYEATKLCIPIHRAIATVKGSAFYTDEQLIELAYYAAKPKIEVIICPWKLAGLVFENPNRIFSDLRLSDKEIGQYLFEINRCIKIGFRGFLVWDKDLLQFLNYKRSKGVFPSGTIFKLSTFANSVNIFNFISAVRKGADTINVANGLSLDQLKKARFWMPEAVKMDVHIVFWQMAFIPGTLELMVNNYDRIKDAPEIARIASPVYFKFEAGTHGISVYNVPRLGWTFKDLAEHKRGDVRTAAEIIKTIREKYPQLKLSDWGPKDLRVPKV